MPLLLTTALLVVVGCAPDDPDLSPVGERGRELARSEGCSSCHGRAGNGGVGPSWIGLAGSPVELEDGSTVTADHVYLRRSIVEPDADIVAGYGVKMPEADLTDDEVEAIVSYIEELR